MGHSASKESSGVDEVAEESGHKTHALCLEQPSIDVQCAKYRSYALPLLGEFDALVRVEAAGLNPVDVKRMNFTPTQGLEGAGYHREGRFPSLRFPFPYVLGCDGCGVVEECGNEASAARNKIKVGDRVYFHMDITKSCGSLSQLTVVDVRAVVSVTLSHTKKSTGKLPSSAELASIPCASWTAYVALYDKLKIESRRSILINGGAGGVGSTAIQMAKKATGCFVIATCSEHNAAYVRSLGADVTIDYNREDVVERVLQLTSGFGVDYVLEAVDAELGIRHAEALRFGGSLCQLVGSPKSVPPFFFSRQLSLHHVFLGGLHQSTLTMPLLKQIGETVLEMYCSDMFSTALEVLPFERARDGLALLSTGHARGKLVVGFESNGK